MIEGFKDDRGALEARGNPIFIEIGLIANSWGMLDREIDVCIWRLAAVSPVLGACITAQIWTTDSRLKAVKALMIRRGFDEAATKKVNLFSNDIQGLSEKRNRAVHDAILFSKPEGMPARMEVTAKGKPVFAMIPVDAAELRKDRLQIETKLKEFIQMHTEIASRLDSLPEIPESKLLPINWSYEFLENKKGQTP